MPRLARVVVPGVPHHVTQRGNRRQTTFFTEADYRAYRALLADWCARGGVAIWSYCLMPNHVHLVAVPGATDALHRAIAETHRRYTLRINAREEWTGSLWQGRFASFPMDERHLMAAVRYVELNPVRAGLVAAPGDWPWSSARARLGVGADPLLDAAPMRERIDDWAAYLAAGLDDDTAEALRLHQRTGRPLGSDGFIRELEWRAGRLLRPRKPGRPPKQK